MEKGAFVKIEFIPSSPETQISVPEPEKSSAFIPDWYKKAEPANIKNPIFKNDGSLHNTSLKMCMPFLDSLTSGYIQKTWCDIYIKNNKKDETVEFIYSHEPKIIGTRERKAIETYEFEYYPIEFFWHIEWINKLPRGYSALITHPLNRNDLPFTTLSAIIDSDKYHHAPSGNLPFYIKNGFEGLIPAGTPMYQIIPIKRDPWKKEILPFTIENKKRFSEQKKYFWGFYKNFLWQKKEYL